VCGVGPENKKVNSHFFLHKKKKRKEKRRRRRRRNRITENVTAWSKSTPDMDLRKQDTSQQHKTKQRKTTDCRTNNADYRLLSK
jgi:hypothetical protein